ncbi:MAG: right-handed parallel beta-helix repeat-containing protein, partial [Ignavibacteriaceae bacterium]|nr:right-handed parallel beta-helix repeat-containing protein [Ignavibacteriaceae bacterium]
IGAGDDFNEQFKFWAIPNQSWGGLVFNSGSGGTIQYCNIRNAVTGIACYNTLPIIQHNSIFDNSTGISLYNIGTSSNEISYNLIQDNSSKGVYLSSASPKLYSNTITNNGQYGVYCYYNSSPYLYDNIISGHTGSGLYCTSYSSAKLVPWNASGCCWGHGDNNISNNSGRGINASYWSNLYLGSSPYGGFNSICDNTGYELSAMYSCNIMAEINWWGTSPEFYTYQSTFDNLPYLSNPPNGIQKAGVTENGETSYQSINNGIDRNLEKAYMLQLEGKFDEAIAAYSNFINTKPSDPEAAYALVRIEECHRLSNKEGFLNYLNKDVKSLAAINNYLAVVLLELESQYFVKDEKYKEAIDNFQKINKEYNLNSYVDKYSIFNTGYIYLKFLNDVDNAVKSFEELTNKYPEDDLVGEFKYLLRGVNPNMPKNSSLSTAILPSEFEVTQNYPNPFNPTTKISYQLPVDAPVTLKVYDLLGREVATLINEERQAGTHEVEVDANNPSSGVYLYKITMNDFAKTMKMIVIK